MLETFYDSTYYQSVTKAIDAAGMRQKVIANNIANVDTPHFKRVEVNFEDAFKQALNNSPRRLVGFDTNSRHFPINPHPNTADIHPTMWRQNDDFSRADDNNVDMDVEMVELAKNEIMMNAMIEVLNRKMKTINAAIAGRSM